MLYTGKLRLIRSGVAWPGPPPSFIQKPTSSDRHLGREGGRVVKQRASLGVLSLGIVKGTTITLIADGSDEKNAVALWWTW